MKPHAFFPLVTYPDANEDAVVGRAVNAAKLLGADLHAVALTPTFPAVSNALSRLLLDVPEMIRGAEAAGRKRAAHLLDLVAEKAAAAGVTATRGEASAESSLIGEEAARHARYFDFSLIGWEAANETTNMVAEAVVFGSGRPVLLLPEQAELAAFDNVGIAWDGSRVAARAAADARTLFQKAGKVTVLTVLDEKPLKERDAGQRFAKELAMRGVSAKAEMIRAEDCPIAETLQRKARELGCDVLAMGGYGHSRMRDFVLGGATEGVLNDLRLPVLLSH